MKQLLYVVFLLLMPLTNLSSQENKSRFGVEVGIVPWHFDTFSRRTPFSISGFVGGSYEHFFSNSFSVKSTLGVYNITYKWWSGNEGYHTGKEERKWQTILGLTIEPRYYFWNSQQRWGNVFAGIPVLVETGPFQDNPHNNIFKTPTIRVIPVIGYQYYLASHFFVEVNAGLGWSIEKYPTQSYNDFDYLLGVRFGYSF